MQNPDSLRTLPSSVLWKFLKWLVYAQGRYVGVRIQPLSADDEANGCIQLFVRRIAAAPKEPSDSQLGVAFELPNGRPSEAELVAQVARYVAARHVALDYYAADFEPHHADTVQDDALRRITDQKR